MSFTETNVGVSQVRQHLTLKLKESVSQLFGIHTDEIDDHASFLDMGADSLSLLRVSQVLQEKFQVKIPFRSLLEELSSIDEVAAHIERTSPPQTQPIASEPPRQATAQPLDLSPLMPEVALADHVPENGKTIVSEPVELTTDAGTLERILSQQMRVLQEQVQQQTRIMSLQLEMLQAARVQTEPAPAPAAVKTNGNGHANGNGNGNGHSKVAPTVTIETPKPAKNGEFATEAFVAYHPIKKEKQRGLTPQQQEHLDRLIEQVTARTKESKRLTQAYRPFLADSRTAAGFRPTWKEMCYPLVIDRGKGSHVHDVDGNEYIDLTMGFGALLYGHSPDFLVDALQEAVADGVRLGGQSHIVGQTAELICEMTGVERVAFCNSGTEAVMSALRLARTVTGRTKVALFEGSYHGTFDGVMVRPGANLGNGTFNAIPLAPGVPPHMIEDVLLLGYDDAASLEVIRAHAHELAAVLIEPPRSRHPDVQPRAFLHELRKITEESGTALIFDEVVTGFRFHPGGVQALFDVKADLVTYGKAIGGGVPVAVVGGKAKFMDATDGGMWTYGDMSYPRAETTFFAGTYFKNPLIVAAVWACLNHIKNSGAKFYEELNSRTTRLANALNAYFEQAQVPMRTTHLGSLMRFLYPPEFKLMELFYYHLLAKGIYICETRNCFLSSAHTDEDVDRIVAAVKETIAEMRAGGILPDPPSDSPNGDGAFKYSIDDPFRNLANAFPTTTTNSPIARDLPLTEGQKQLWFLARMGGEASIAYNLSVTLEMRGPFNVAAMRDSLQAVVNNHEALRITISPEGDRQYVRHSLQLEVPLVELSNTDERDAFLAEEAKKPFDLEQGPLVRACILRLEAQQHLLVLTTHHIVTDGWSLGVLVGELSARYSAACQNVACVLPPAAQFGEYVAAEVKQQESGAIQLSENYWLEQFKDPVAPLELPLDHKRPAVQTYTGSRAYMTIDAALCNRLEQYSSQQNSTLFMLLLASFNLLLHKLSGQNDVVIGIPSAGQSSFGSSLIGYCVNVLPLRSKLAGHAGIDDYLAHVKRIFFDAHDHQAYPFSSLVRKLKLARDASRPPLVAVMFNLDRASSKPQFFGVEVDVLQNTTDSAQFELDLNITKTGDELQLECDFNTSLFSPDTIERWLGHYRALLVDIVENRTKAVSELSILSDSERDQVVRVWNDTTVLTPENDSFHRLFERQVELSPNAVAATCGDQLLTYTELNQRANQLARHLVRSGAGPEQIVALLAERGLDFLVSMLAVFKTGSAYLPLDPRHPAHRIAQVLAESGVSLVLTTRQFSTAIEQVQDKLSKTAPKFLFFEELARQSEANDNLPSVHLPEALAYVIYTSGSTGVPKGVMVTQQGMLNHLYVKIFELYITAQDSVAQNASQCFDISVWQFLTPLLVGGRVHIFSDEIAHDGARLLEQVSRRNISILETVPALLHAIVKSDAWQQRRDELDLDCLRLVVVTGEALPPDVCNRWLERYPEIPLVNAYGPTECSDDVTHFHITEKLDADVVTVPIGKALANMRLYIVDKYWRPVPIGVAGELLIGGDGVARGYLSRPELTAKRFVPDGFGEQTGARLYCTGDLARYLPDGNIEFLGRVDHQVKVRGHRIELGEIEAVLTRHAGVRQAVVLAREDTPGEKRLVAYLVVAQGDEVNVSELRRYLKEQLPEYLIPSAYVMLNELPVTTNGKVDRRALPAPEQSRPELEHEYVAARTPLEEQLCGIWSEVLPVERVGVYDNFFELGGDSILTIQVVSRARQVGLEITALDIFQHQTVAELAEVVGSQKTKTPETTVEAAPSQALTREAAARPSPDLTLVEDAYPLSPTQQGMLFHHLFAPGSTAYFEQISWSLHGSLDVAALRRAWEGVIANHSILRTAFAWEGLDEPLQIVRQRVGCALVEHDWRELSGAEQATRLEAYLEEDRERGFDLAEPPMRFSLIRMDDETAHFIWSYHHILLDGWAVMLVLKEVFNRYEAHRQGIDLATQSGPPFKNYISWLQQQDLSKAEAFWRRTLAGFTEPTPLGVDKSPGGQIAQAEEFAHHEMLLSAQATSALKTLARQNHLTMSTLVLGAWGLLLSKYSGQDDVVFGTVGSGRPAELEGFQEMVGLFISTMPTRVRIDREMTVLEWLKQFQEQQAEARQYEYSPLVQVQGWSDVPRGLPLFESIVAFENYPVNTSLAAQRGSVESRNVRAVERVNYPIFVVVGPGAGLSITIYFDGRRFDAAAIERMHGHLQTLLERMVDDPGQRLAELSLMNKAERRRLLFDWNATTAAYPAEACVHQLFEQQAARTPDAIAVAFEGQELTYAELDEKASALARVLRTLSVGPESLAGVFMERSPEMLIALLAVLKAGGAYVPLDPQYPRERIAYMMNDAGLRVLLTQQRLRSSLPAEVVAPVLSVDEVDLEGESATPAETGVTAENRAYVIYTSGSTGMPKGVEIPHRALVNFLFAMRDSIGIDPSDTLLAVTSLSFDIAGLEIFLPLTTGAKVEFASRRDINGVTRLIKLLRESGASIMQATPTAWELLLNLGWRNDAGLKVLCGGEAMPAGLGARLVEEKDARVWNLYGPTETTIWSTTQQIASGKSITIGRPIGNTQIYILDQFHEPVPVGVVGELLIGGDGVARGYLSRPELTAEKFIPDCFSGQAGARLYRTGDVARYLPDGNIEFLGRSDHQVKIHGHRIELGEIEAVLSRHEDVRQAVVVARQDAPGEKRLVAYLMVAEGSEVNVSDLRRYLKEQLPEYLIPAAYVTLSELPLTANGKVDRRALPAPEHSRPELAREYVAARTPVEEQLCGIWSEVLRVERVGVYDNFFELGGDSILTIQVVSRARHAGLNLSPAELFMHPTIAELSEIVGKTQQLPEVDAAAVPLTPIQHWFFEQNLPEQHHFNQAALLDIPASLEPSLIEKAVEELFMRHDALRLRFVNDDGRWQQTVSENIDGPFSVHDLSSTSSISPSEQPGAIERVAEEIQKSLNLAEGRVARIALIELSETSRRLLVVIHHLAVDTTSWRILLEDFQATYASLERQQRVELPAPTTSFAAWSRALSRFAQSAELNDDAEYWRHAVSQPASPMSLDFEGENTEDSSAFVLTTLSREETRWLLHESPKAFRALPSEVVLTALAQAYGESLLIEMEGHGREAISDAVDLSRTVGWFTSLYPVRLDVSHVEDPLAALKLVKEQTRSVPRGGLGFGVLKYLNAESEIGKLLRQTPRPEISFNYIGEQAMPSARENAISVAPEGYGRNNSERGVRPYLLMITAEIRKEQLSIRWSYSRNLHRETTIRDLARSFKKAFKSLIDCCETTDTTLFTPSDFPGANLSQMELDEFITSIGALS